MAILDVDVFHRHSFATSVNLRPISLFNTGNKKEEEEVTV